MPEKIDAEVVREVTACIEKAIEQNRRAESIVVVVLVALFCTGLGLLILGATTGQWDLVFPGGLVQLTIVFPIRRLIKLREDNMRLRILPQLIRLADTKEAKTLAARLVRRLIQKV